MADIRAKYEVQQMLRYLADGTPISPRTSPRSPDLSRSDELLREKYDELNHLMLSHIAQRRTIGHLYSSYDLDFKKVSPEDDKTRSIEKENRKLKKSAKRVTEIIDQGRGVRLKIWEIPSDSEDEPEDRSDEEEVEDDEKYEYRDDASEQTCNSTVTIREVNTDGEEIESGDEKASTSSKTKHVSFAEDNEPKGDPIPRYDSNSLEALILKDILRNQRKTPKYTNAGNSSQTISGNSHYRYRSRKRSPRKKKPLKKDLKPPSERSPRQKTKCDLDNKIDSSSNTDVRRWIREKNKIARKKLKEERRKEFEEMQKEQENLNVKVSRLLESGEKFEKWLHDKKKEALLHRKLQQRVDEIHKGNATLEKRSEETSNRRMNQTKEQFEIRKASIKRRQRRIMKRKEEEEEKGVVTKKTDKNEDIHLEPAVARLINDEKLQAKAAKKKFGVSVRGTLNKAAKQMNKDEDNTQIETKDLNSSKVKTPNGSRNRPKNSEKINERKEEGKRSGRRSANSNNVTKDIDPIDQVRKTNRMTYNAWIKIKRDAENNQNNGGKSKNKVDPDLERLLPTLSKERIRRATESKKFTDTGSQKAMTPSPPTATRPSSGKYQETFNSANVAPHRPRSAMDFRRNDRPNNNNNDNLTQRPASARPSGSSRKSRINHELNIVLEGVRPEPQGCEIPDDSSCQGSNQSRPSSGVSRRNTDDVISKQHSERKPNPGLEVLNPDSVFITA